MFNPETGNVIHAPSRKIALHRGNSVFRFRVIADTHCDAEGFRNDLFKYFINEQLKDKDSLWLHAGDISDSDRPTTRHKKEAMFVDRKDAFKQEDKKITKWLDDEFVPKFTPIAHSCLGILDGDHYCTFFDGTTSGQYLAKKLNVPYLGERSSFIDIHFTAGRAHLQYIIHARHGRGCAPTHGGDVNALIKQDANTFADWHIGAHSHKENCHPERFKFLSSRGAERSKIVWYMRGGSFLDGFPTSGAKTYAYRAEYNPLPCGWGEMELHLGMEYMGKNKDRPLEIRMSKASIIAA